LFKIKQMVTVFN